MLDAAKYSAMERLRDGRRIEIRALRPEDKADMLGAIDRTSAQSLYRRFFGPKRFFSKKEVAFFLDIDFINHVALVAVVKEGNRTAIVAGGRYVTQRPGVAEVAFAVIDDYQRQGIGDLLLDHLATVARDAGFKEFVAEVLPDNIAMLKMFEKSGLKIRSERESDVVHVALQL
jgi:GNAT superfamily N-acetyltransferase